MAGIEARCEERRASVKLEYSRSTGKANFGDDLNDWLWEEIAPGLVDEDPSSILLGMGTIFSGWFTRDLPKSVPKALLGSGGGKSGGVPDLADGWVVYGVRGPLTAAYSGLPQQSILTDPAMTLHRLRTLATDRAGVGFMPHIWSEGIWDWRKTAESVGLTYLSPSDDPHALIAKIGTLERLVTEAMHGAIVADALRTPWVPVQISPQFEPTKWADWAGSLNQPVIFDRLPELRASPQPLSRKGFRGTIKGLAQGVGLSLPHVYRQPSRAWEISEAKSLLNDLAFMRTPHLSGTDNLNAALDRFYTALSALVADKASGRFGEN